MDFRVLLLLNFEGNVVISKDHVFSYAWGCLVWKFVRIVPLTLLCSEEQLTVVPEYAK